MFSFVSYSTAFILLHLLQKLYRTFHCMLKDVTDQNMDVMIEYTYDLELILEFAERNRILQKWLP